MLLDSLVRALLPKPIEHFCCCPAVAGVYFTLALNLLINVLFVTSAVCHFIWLDSSWSYTRSNLPLEAWLGGFMLGGIPFILAGFAGTFTKWETLIRLYWYYLLLLFFAALVWSVFAFLAPMGCHNLPAAVMRSQRSWACGVYRIFNIACVIAFVAVPGYLVALVHSYADNLAYEFRGGLSEIARSKRMSRFSAPWADVRIREGEQNEAHIEKFSSANYGAVFEPLQGVGDSRPIFGGTYHHVGYSAGSV